MGRFIKILSLGLGGLIALAALAFAFAPGIHISSLQMVLNVATGSGANTSSDELLQRLQVPNGYHLSIFARGITNPRMLKRVDDNRLLVSSPGSSEIIQLSDTDGDGRADQQRALLSGLTRPLGLELHDGYLYVAESNQIGRVAYDAVAGELSGDYNIVVAGLTDNGNHWSKTVRIDSDGWMYVAMGSTCNVCEESDSRRAAIMRYRPDGSAGEVYASGLRNSVGLDFAPWNGALYATDNGRDMLGDDYPPCELNRIERNGFYGWPYLNGNNELDPDIGEGKQHLQQSAIAPAYAFRAHNAPLGIHFSASQARTALVALHGSWNRSTPDGYKVVALHWDEGENISATDFMWGFEQDGDIVGRPVDISGDGQGGYFISDDYARVIYRVSHEQLTSVQPRAAIPAEEVVAAVVPRAALTTDPDLALAGELLYRNLPCGECHNEDSATPVILDQLHGRYDLESLSGYFLAPTPPMPRYELSTDQRQQLAHYLLSRD